MTYISDKSLRITSFNRISTNMNRRKLNKAYESSVGRDVEDMSATLVRVTVVNGSLSSEPLNG